MSEKRFVVENDNNEVSIKDKVKDNYPFALAYEHIDDGDNLIQECLSLVVLLNEQQATITELAKKWRVLSQENMQLKDYIDTIFEYNTHICKYLDVEDVQFYCDKNKNYRNPSCLYEKCFDEENLIKIKDEIRRVFE